ncbi:MAG: hypothetical protein WCP45_09880 [Verrucomicrobiota bacterium]|jgi:hypothetical protein
MNCQASITGYFKSPQWGMNPLFPSLGIVTFALNHLLKQLYQPHGERGGEPIAPSPKLMETPPALPHVAG